MNKLLIYTALLAVTACSPQRLQTTAIDGIDDQGRTIYLMTGYGDPDDMTSGSSAKHVKHALSDACPKGVKIVSLQEQPAHNAASEFWYWTAKARCE